MVECNCKPLFCYIWHIIFKPYEYRTEYDIRSFVEYSFSNKPLQHPKSPNGRLERTQDPSNSIINNHSFVNNIIDNHYHNRPPPQWKVASHDTYASILAPILSSIPTCFKQSGGYPLNQQHPAPNLSTHPWYHPLSFKSQPSHKSTCNSCKLLWQQPPAPW